MLPSREGGVASTTVLHPAICAGWPKGKIDDFVLGELELKEMINKSRKLNHHTTESIRAVEGKTAVPPGT